MKRLSTYMMGLALLGLMGCATTDHRRDSDIPWNQPQPWEGSPYIPGVSNRY
jgi:hypothetical protein